MLGSYSKGKFLICFISRFMLCLEFNMPLKNISKVIVAMFHHGNFFQSKFCQSYCEFLVHICTNNNIERHSTHNFNIVPLNPKTPKGIKRCPLSNVSTFESIESIH